MSVQCPIPPAPRTRRFNSSLVSSMIARKSERRWSGVTPGHQRPAGGRPICEWKEVLRASGCICMAESFQDASSIAPRSARPSLRRPRASIRSRGSRHHQRHFDRERHFSQRGRCSPDARNHPFTIEHVQNFSPPEQIEVPTPPEPDPEPEPAPEPELSPAMRHAMALGFVPLPTRPRRAH